MRQTDRLDDASGMQSGDSEADYRRVANFLFREALLLDGGQLEQWLLLLSPDVSYVLTAPSVALARPGKPPAAPVLLMKESFGSLEARVKQLVTPSLTLADNPRPFMRRFITNILVDRDAGNGQLCASSYAMIHRARGAQDEPNIFSTGRRDRFIETDEGLRLVRREAQLDAPLIAARNISALF